MHLPTVAPHDQRPINGVRYRVCWMTLLPAPCDEPVDRDQQPEDDRSTHHQKKRHEEPCYGRIVVLDTHPGSNTEQNAQREPRHKPDKGCRKTRKEQFHCLRKLAMLRRVDQMMCSLTSCVSAAAAHLSSLAAVGCKRRLASAPTKAAAESSPR